MKKNIDPHHRSRLETHQEHFAVQVTGSSAKNNIEQQMVKIRETNSLSHSKL